MLGAKAAEIPGTNNIYIKLYFKDDLIHVQLDTRQTVCCVIYLKFSNKPHNMKSLIILRHS